MISLGNYICLNSVEERNLNSEGMWLYVFGLIKENMYKIIYFHDNL